MAAAIAMTTKIDPKDCEIGQSWLRASVERGRWQVPSRGPPRCGISSNACQTCRYESNHCYSCWMCSARGWYAFSRRGSVLAVDDERRSSILKLKTEGLSAYKITVIEQLAYSTRTRRSSSSHRSPLRNCRQASDSQLLNTWFSPEQESRPCHVCLRAVGMDTGRPVSRTIRDWVAVHRRRRI